MPAVKDKVTQLGLEYGLMTQFTSFVAVEEQTVVEGGQRRTIQVPVELPQGVSPEGVFGVETRQAQLAKAQAGSFYSYSMANRPVAPPPANATTVDVFSASEAVGVADAMRHKNGRGDAQFRDVDLSTKLHRDLLAAYNCWKSKQANCAGVKGGKVRVEVWLESGIAKDQMNRLLSAGLKLEQDKSIAFATGATSVRGTIDLAKLPNLAQLAGVRLVSLAK
jgi:hypothetical protein